MLRNTQILKGFFYRKFSYFLIKIGVTFGILPIYYYLCSNLNIKKVMAKENIKIAVAGTGYVGLSIATLLSQHHEVVAVDVVPEKVELINHRRSPIQDEYI